MTGLSRSILQVSNPQLREYDLKLQIQMIQYVQLQKRLQSFGLWNPFFALH